MRKIASLKTPIEGFRRLMTYSCDEGTYLFLYESEADSPCTADEWYETIEAAEDVALQRFGVGHDEWEVIADPVVGGQHDWIKPTRVKMDAAGNKQWGEFDPMPSV